MRGTLITFVFLALIFLPAAQTSLPGRAIPLEPPAPPVGEPGRLFADVTTHAGISSSRVGVDRLIGQAWGDYDQDGWYDLYLTDPAGPNLLYRNNGDGTFSLSPLAESVALPGTMSSGAVFADYDNDGFPDLYVLRRNRPNVLFHNEGGRAFTDVSTQAGVDNPLDGKTAAWADYDNDGFLDLYVTNWSCYPDCGRPIAGDTDALYHNNGDGTFSDVTRILGSKTGGAGFVASFVDYDNDGDQDIYLVNDEFIHPIGNALWRNDGPGCSQYAKFSGWCFTEVSEEANADTLLMGMGLAVADFDGNGYFDFYFTNAGPMVLLQNLGDGTFADVSALSGVDLGGYGTGWGAVALDYDNDGYRDLYVALTDTAAGMPLVNPLFRNNGDGTFADVTAQSGMVAGQRTLGVAYADYDRDGWVDLVIGNYEAGYKLYRNQTWLTADGAENARLVLTLKGGESPAGSQLPPVNRDAVGARVTLTTRDGRVQMQEVQIGSSLGAGNATTLYFGLGQQTIQTLEIRWPNGQVDAYQNVPANMHYTILYGEKPASAPADRPEASIVPTLLLLASLLILFSIAILLNRRSF